MSSSYFLNLSGNQTTELTLTTEYTSVLQRVKDRGVLLCGVEGGLPSLSYIQPNEPIIPGTLDFFADAKGMDADFCRVVATAVFGDYHGKVAFTKLEAGNRFNALIGGKVDVLFRNTTWTAGRDAGVGNNPQNIDFGQVTFYDGQRFLVKNRDINTLEELKDQTVCIQKGTTTITNTIALSNELALNLQFIPIDGNTQAVVNAYQNGDCSVLAGDGSQLATRNTIHDNDSPEEPSQELTLGEIIPDYPISFEPLAPAMVEDSEWRDIVNYAIWTTIYAEIIDVTQDNVNDWRNPDTTRLISQEFVNSGNELGQALGLGAKSDFVYKIIEQFGNYGEIYACNLGHIKALQDRGPNQPALWYDFDSSSWRPNPGGLLIAPPFGR
jgi:general L-amino acid transport system substrate-binding protein